MGLLDAGGAARPGTELDRAGEALEALVLRQLLKSSGAFRSSDAPGASLHTDLFVDALADAVAAAGGLGIGAAIAGALPDGGEPAAPAGLSRLPFALPAPSAGPARPPASPAPATDAGVDALDLVSGPGRITSRFGIRSDPFHGHAAHHRGVDVGAPEGSPILAAADGVVRRAGDRGGYGNCVEIDHGDGTSTLYAHAAELRVREGERVVRGQEIATVGATGRATGAHLHFELRVNDRPVDPGRVLKSYGIRVEAGDVEPHDPRRRAP